MTIPPAVSDAEITASVVCMMCGLPGSGKTTTARGLEDRGMIRLSIDQEIWRRFGRYGIDYPPNRYEELQVVARGILDKELGTLLAAGTPVVLDYSFWCRADRERYKSMIEQHRRPWKLIVLRVAADVLRHRLALRSQRFDADAAFPVSDERLATYARGFEWPDGEGETAPHPSRASLFYET